MRTTKKLAFIASVLFASTTAYAQKAAQEIDVQRGPAAELYIRKRPPAPEAPILSEQLKKLLVSTEKRRDDKRTEAIGLLEGFLKSNPTGEARAEGMFKLAELLWEEARRVYLIAMDDYGRKLDYPESDSALGYYRKVLNLDADNARAHAGIADIVAFYRRNAYALCARGSWIQCRFIARKGLAVDPADAYLLQLQDAAVAGESGEEPTLPAAPPAA